MNDTVKKDEEYVRLSSDLGGENAVRSHLRAQIDKEIKSGKLPTTKKRSVLQGPLLQVSPQLIRNGPFRFHHPPGVKFYDLQNPLVQENSWGYCYYTGPTLYPFHLVVYATMLQLFGTSVMAGPRKAFQMLRVMDKGASRPPVLENPEIAIAADPYERMEAIYGEALITMICEEIYGYRSGPAVRKVTNALIDLMQGQAFTHVNPKRKHKQLPRWANLGDAPIVLDHESIGDFKREFHTGELNPRMQEILGYDPLNHAASPFRRHYFFDAFFKNGMDPRYGFPFFVSHFHSEIMRVPDNDEDKANLSYIEKRVIRGLLGDETALQLYMLICALTNANNPEFLYGYDTIYDLMGCGYVHAGDEAGKKSRTKKNKSNVKNVAIDTRPNYAELRKQLMLRLPKLIDLGVTTETGSGEAKRKKRDPERKTKLLRITRTFPPSS